jgi:hypothetical protein
MLQAASIFSETSELDAHPSGRKTVYEYGSIGIRVV